jgi:hypothetical protein
MVLEVGTTLPTFRANGMKYGPNPRLSDMGIEVPGPSRSR